MDLTPFIQKISKYFFIAIGYKIKVLVYNLYGPE